VLIATEEGMKLSSCSCKNYLEAAAMVGQTLRGSCRRRWKRPSAKALSGDRAKRISELQLVSSNPSRLVVVVAVDTFSVHIQQHSRLYLGGASFHPPSSLPSFAADTASAFATSSSADQVVPPPKEP
jgi:hypothetical protein